MNTDSTYGHARFHLSIGSSLLSGSSLAISSKTMIRRSINDGVQSKTSVFIITHWSFRSLIWLCIYLTFIVATIVTDESESHIRYVVVPECCKHIIKQRLKI